MRLPNGYGSVSKLSGARRNPFVARIPTGMNNRGSTKHQIIGYFPTRETALDAIAAFHRNPTDKLSMTLEQLYAEWSTRKYKRITKATENNYRASWLRFSPLYRQKVKDIRTAQLQSILDSDETNGMSQSSMSKDKALATMLWNYAMENDIVFKNYAEFMELPKNTEESTKDAFSSVEIKKIEAAATAGIPWADTILMLCYTGFRISEFLQLTRFSYNAEEQTLTGGMKTSAGKDRVIPIHNKISPYVKKWASEGGNHLICNLDGKGFSAKYYRDTFFYPTLEAIGVRKLTPHCCRHTFATLCAQAKIDPIEIQRLMGHARYATSADIYTHLHIEQLRDAMGKLG